MSKTQELVNVVLVFLSVLLGSTHLRSRLVSRSNLNVWTFLLLYKSTLICFVLLFTSLRHNSRDSVFWNDGRTTVTKKPFLVIGWLYFLSVTYPVQPVPESLPLASNIMLLQHLKGTLWKLVCLCPTCFCIANSSMPVKWMQYFGYHEKKAREGSNLGGSWSFQIIEKSI